jgi:predicted ATP-dependent serine protease
MIGREIVYLRDFAEEAERLKKDYGYTKAFSTGVSMLDDYLGGGYGRNHGYEIVLLFGPPKIGKSSVALNFLKMPILSGQRVGILTLEDAGEDVYNRIRDILGDEAMKRLIMSTDTVHMMPPEDLLKSWKLIELVDMIEDWFTNRNLDVILLDHLQFAFEGAESIKGENEYVSQRVFMQKLNQLMKKLKKTIILVSHVSKDARSAGSNKVYGSSAIAQVCTKNIEINRSGDSVTMRLWGSRFTRTPDYEFRGRINGTKLEGESPSAFPVPV